MKLRIASFILAALSTSVFAHDPSEHKKDGDAQPDCAQMKNMDMSKIDPNDPVMKAMHEKCAAHGDHGGKAQGSPTPSNESKSDRSAPAPRPNDSHDMKH